MFNHTMCTCSKIIGKLLEGHTIFINKLGNFKCTNLIYKLVAKLHLSNTRGYPANINKYISH